MLFIFDGVEKGVIKRNISIKHVNLIIQFIHYSLVYSILFIDQVSSMFDVRTILYSDIATAFSLFHISFPMNNDHSHIVVFNLLHFKKEKL